MNDRISAEDVVLEDSMPLTQAIKILHDAHKTLINELQQVISSMVGEIKELRGRLERLEPPPKSEIGPHDLILDMEED